MASLIPLFSPYPEPSRTYPQPSFPPPPFPPQTPPSLLQTLSRVLLQ